MSQTEQILSMLKAGPITPMDALQRAGCFRTAARICELRQRGYQIETEYITTPGGARVAQYRLATDRSNQWQQ